ncbi:MAG: PIN domain-containing protein [Anaerolineales bacterium]|nr:PIN domain-containing protein [Anaerolineales bacterium]
MKVLVDTSIWSLALRRGTTINHELVSELYDLIRDVRVQIIGPIRQELLSGIKSEEQFETLKSYLSAFPDLLLETYDYEKAAEFHNINRKHGIQGSNTDFLICAVAFHRDLEIYTTDNDFDSFRQYIPIKLYKPVSSW